MKRTILSGLLLLLVHWVYPQEFEIDDKKWCAGQITLVTGPQLSGLTFYDEKKQTVYFREENEMRGLKASRVLRFYFYDSAQQIKRSFISIPFKRNENSTARPEFLEVLREFEKYTLLARHTNRKVTIPRNKYTSPQTINELVEDWYLADDEVAPKLYFSFVHRDVFGPKVEFFNGALFSQLTSSCQAEINAFSSSRKLNAEKPLDNLKLLDYARELGCIPK